MTYFLFITALTVSIDSFVCGFSLAYTTKKKPLIVLGIAFTVLIMCLITNYSTAFFAGKIDERTASLGGLILIGVGVYNLVMKNDGAISQSYTFGQILLSGFAVGLDGALANLSLSLMGINQFYVPIVIALMHALTITLGIALASTPLAKKFGKIEFVPPVILIILGTYKLLGLFI